MNTAIRRAEYHPRGVYLFDEYLLCFLVERFRFFHHHYLTCFPDGDLNGKGKVFRTRLTSRVDLTVRAIP